MDFSGEESSISDSLPAQAEPLSASSEREWYDSVRLQPEPSDFVEWDPYMCDSNYMPAEGADTMSGMQPASLKAPLGQLARVPSADS